MNHSNAQNFDRWYRIQQEGRLRHPRAWENVAKYAERVLVDDPTFPLPSREQWDQIDQRLQRCVSEMVRDADTQWFVYDDKMESDEYRMIRDLFARRFG